MKFIADSGRDKGVVSTLLTPPPPAPPSVSNQRAPATATTRYIVLEELNLKLLNLDLNDERAYYLLEVNTLRPRELLKTLLPSSTNYYLTASAGFIISVCGG